MSNLKAKLKKQGGFTMVELLIVVAIIGILAAVSIPLFNNALEKARHGVDAANNRSAISLGNAEAAASLNPENEFGTAGKEYYYIVDNSDNGDHQGALVEKDDTAVTDATKVTPECADGTGEDALMVKVTYKKDGATPLDKFTVETNWTFDEDGHVETKSFTAAP